MADLTVIILTKNEERNLRKCIESFRGIAKRFVIVDSFSTDRTLEIARESGANIYRHQFRSHSEQFNWALENADIATQWIMKIDADEELTEELADEINRKLDCVPEDVNGIILRRRVYFMKRWLKHGGKYPEFLLRIFRTGYGMSEMKMMDEHIVITGGKTEIFENDFIDNNNKNLEWWISKHNWYSNKEVLDVQISAGSKNTKQDMKDATTSFQAKKKRFLKNYGYYSMPKFIRAHLYYIYRYYVRLGFLDGTEGKIYTFLQAYWYRYLIDAKMYECEKFNINMQEQNDLKTAVTDISGGGRLNSLLYAAYCPGRLVTENG